MTYNDLRNKDRIRDLNHKSSWGLSSKQLEQLTKKHQKTMQSGDEYTCLLLEYRLDHTNFHTEAGLLHAGEHEKVLNASKIR